MAQEWYEYAISMKKFANHELKKDTRIVIFLGLIILLLPLLKYNIWCGLILAILYCFFRFYNFKEKDDYAKKIFRIGITITTVGIEILSMVLLMGGNKKTFGLYAIIGITILVILYEIIVLLKIKQKKYSTCTAPKSNKGIVTITSGVLTGTALGGYLSRNVGYFWRFFFFIISLMLFLVAITFLQKYVIYKILKNKADL